MHGHRYFLTVVDDYSRHTWLFLLKHKYEVASCIKRFITLVENQFSCTVKAIRTDNGSEFNLQSFYQLKGILHQTSCVATPQQIGVMERKHQDILNITRALLFQSSLLRIFWNFATAHAVYLLNHIPRSALNNKTPFEMLLGKLPDLTSLKVFGCKYYASTLPNHRTKLDPRARACINIGHKVRVKGYILYDTHT